MISASSYFAVTVIFVQCVFFWRHQPLLSLLAALNNDGMCGSVMQRETRFTVEVVNFYIYGICLPQAMITYPVTKTKHIILILHPRNGSVV